MQYYSVCLTEIRELWYYIEAEDSDSAIDMVEAVYKENREPDEEIISLTEKTAHEIGESLY